MVEGFFCTFGTPSRLVVGGSITRVVAGEGFVAELRREVDSEDGIRFVGAAADCNESQHDQGHS